jgi:hypothetical protein
MQKRTIIDQEKPIVKHTTTNVGDDVIHFTFEDNNNSDDETDEDLRTRKNTDLVR